MERKSLFIYGGCLAAISTLKEEQIPYLIKILSAQAQGEILSVLQECLNQIEPLNREERLEVLNRLARELTGQVVAEIKPIALAPKQSKQENKRQLNRCYDEHYLKNKAEAEKVYPGLSLSGIAEKLGINKKTFIGRLKTCKTAEEAMTTPLNKKYQRRGVAE